jgi:hypothetical protein
MAVHSDGCDGKTWHPLCVSLTDPCGEYLSAGYLDCLRVFILRVSAFFATTDHG